MSTLKADGLEIRIDEGRIVWCGPAEYEENEREALCCTWEYLEEDEIKAFTEMNERLSEFMRELRKNHRPVIARLTERIARLRAEGWDI